MTSREIDSNANGFDLLYLQIVKIHGPQSIDLLDRLAPDPCWALINSLLRWDLIFSGMEDGEEFMLRTVLKMPEVRFGGLAEFDELHD